MIFFLCVLYFIYTQTPSFQKRSFGFFLILTWDQMYWGSICTFSPKIVVLIFNYQNNKFILWKTEKIMKRKIKITLNLTSEVQLPVNLLVWYSSRLFFLCCYSPPLLPQVRSINSSSLISAFDSGIITNCPEACLPFWYHVSNARIQWSYCSKLYNQKEMPPSY